MKKIIGFFGGDSQVGTSMLAQSLAELLQQRGQRVLYILGSGKFGDEFFSIDEHRSIDDLKASVRSGRVKREDLFQNLTRARGLWVLPAVRNPLTSKYFTENTYEIMLKEVEDEFDYTVIDGGCDANQGLTISALNTADFRFFVTTQQSKVIRRMLLAQKNIIEPLNRTGELIINKYMKDPALLLKGDILTLCERECAFTVPYIEYGWQAEMEGKSLMRYGKFAKAVAALGDLFESETSKEILWKKHFL